MSEKDGVGDSLSGKVKAGTGAMVGGVVGGGTIFGLLINMGMSNSARIEEHSTQIERNYREIESVQSVHLADTRRIEQEINRRLRPLEVQSAQGDRFTARDGDALEARIDALETLSRWTHGNSRSDTVVGDQ